MSCPFYFTVSTLHLLWTLWSLPRGSYPTPFLGRLLFKITDLNHKTRYPKGVGYEPLGGIGISKAALAENAKTSTPESLIAKAVTAQGLAKGSLL